MYITEFSILMIQKLFLFFSIYKLIYLFICSIFIGV